MIFWQDDISHPFVANFYRIFIACIEPNPYLAP